MEAAIDLRTWHELLRCRRGRVEHWQHLYTVSTSQRCDVTADDDLRVSAEAKLHAICLLLRQQFRQHIRPELLARFSRIFLNFRTLLPITLCDPRRVNGRYMSVCLSVCLFE